MWVIVETNMVETDKYVYVPNVKSVKGPYTSFDEANIVLSGKTYDGTTIYYIKEVLK